MIWVLIIIVTGWGGYSQSIEFNNKESCEYAKRQVLNDNRFSPVSAICSPKGEL